MGCELASKVGFWCYFFVPYGQNWATNGLKMPGKKGKMLVYGGGKKGETAIRMVGLVGKSVKSGSGNRDGGRKWEE